METRGLGVNESKTEVMVRNMRGEEQASIEDRHGRQLSQEDSFKYLGSMVDSKGGTELDMRSRIRAGWAKCREVSSVVYLFINFIYFINLFI